MTVEVKICGTTRAEDAQAALDAGADYVGFVLYAGSPRCVSVTEMNRMLRALDGEVRAVGVFVNEARARVEEIAGECGLFAVQLHGDEDPEEFADMTVPVWRALRAGQGDPGSEAACWQAERYVVDAAVPGRYGGTGVTADWQAAATLAAGHPVMLAGGLTPENVAEAVRRVCPLGVDAVSGVESEPGRKDPVKLEAFVRRAKTAARGGEDAPR